MFDLIVSANKSKRCWCSFISCRDIVKVLSVKCNLSEEEVSNIMLIVNVSVIVSVIIIFIISDIIKVMITIDASVIISAIISVFAIVIPISR